MRMTMKWNEKKNGSSNSNNRKKNFEMLYICHLWCWQPLTLHLLCVACFIVWIFRSVFILVSLHSLALPQCVCLCGCVCVCSCCKDGNSVSFFYEEIVATTIAPHSKIRRKNNVIVSFIFSPFGWIAWYGAWNARCLSIDGGCCTVGCLSDIAFAVAGIIRFYLKCLVSCSLFPSWLRTFIWKSAVLFSVLMRATHSSMDMRVCLFIRSPFPSPLFAVRLFGIFGKTSRIYALTLFSSAVAVALFCVCQLNEAE